MRETYDLLEIYFNKRLLLLLIPVITINFDCFKQLYYLKGCLHHLSDGILSRICLNEE